jgi:hypothetical protein
MEEYRNKIKGCGDSSTGLTLINLNQEFPDSKVVIIEKNEQEFDRCVEWCDAMYGKGSRDNLIEMREKQKAIEGLRVNQYDLDNKLKDIWEYLVDAPWSNRYLKLTQFNIQSDPFNINLQAAKSLYESIQQDKLNSRCVQS